MQAYGHLFFVAQVVELKQADEDFTTGVFAHGVAFALGGLVKTVIEVNNCR